MQQEREGGTGPHGPKADVAKKLSFVANVTSKCSLHLFREKSIQQHSETAAFLLVVDCRMQPQDAPVDQRWTAFTIFSSEKGRPTCWAKPPNNAAVFASPVCRVWHD
jgi:hypothetical protein